MKTKEMLKTLSELFSDFKYHVCFYEELSEIIHKDISGKENQFFKQLTTQLLNIKEMGCMVYRADRNEYLKGTSKRYFSIHLSSSQYNVRLLVYITDDGIAYFLCAFYERKGKSNTDYSKYLSVLDNRLKQLLGGEQNE